MRRVTPFTAFRGLIATAAAMLLAGIVVFLLPFVLVVMAVVFACCVLRSDSWRESWEMFSSGAGDMLGDVAAAFRGLGELWFAEDR